MFTRGGVYLARLDPAKASEIGKLRPVVILTAQPILDTSPPLLFICPLSSRSDAAFAALHVELPARDGLKVTSFALVEHCRAISTQRILSDRLAQLTTPEFDQLTHRLKRMLNM